MVHLPHHVNMIASGGRESPVLGRRGKLYARIRTSLTATIPFIA